jgi:dihydrofolate synthase/folylpolyglutamate synthase
VTLSYADALDYIFPRITTIKFGLDTTRALLSELGDPQHQFAIVHIGGTNGKGSVATLVAEALAGAGFRTGLYTSPHLVSFRERIRVDGQMIGQSAVGMWVDRLHPLIEATGATFFETTTAVAFADFAARGAEIAVVEVGLGGRLDSTNVVSPLVSAVTKVARDHMKYLGDTLEDIAREKAAIAKPGAPFIIGETDPVLVRVLADAAQHSVQAMDPGAPADVRVVPPETRWTPPLGLAGPHQRRNAAVAQAILEALPGEWRPPEPATKRAFAEARVPGRLDQRGKWLFDVAHNPDGMDALVRALAVLNPPRPLHALVSILGDKEWPQMLVRLDAVVDRGVLTVAPTAQGRGWDLAWLQQWLARPDRPPAHAEWHLQPDFRRAIAQVGRGAGTVVVTGSFHTVGDVMAELGLMDGD